MSRRPQSPTFTNYLCNRREIDCRSAASEEFLSRTAVHAGLVSVITVTFNSAATVRRTIDSVRQQSYSNIEFLVIDGGSNDETLEMLDQNLDVIDFWLSEPDRGISDAFNKGIALSRGEFIALVNSDDWLEPTHIETSVNALKLSNADFTFGDITVHEYSGSPLYTVRGEPRYDRRIRNAMPDLNHPSVVCRRTVYERYGLYDLNLRIAMDYEWFLRGFCLGVRGEYLSGLVSHMLDGGISNRNILRSLSEVRSVSIWYGYSPFLAWARFVSRIVRSRVRLTLEKTVSRKMTEHLRGLLHPRFRPYHRG